MKSRKRNVAAEIIDDLKQINAALKSGTPLREKFTVRIVRSVPEPGKYDAAAVRATRELVAVSQPIFAEMLGVSAALVRAWECGQRKPAPIARRLLDQIRANPATWRGMVRAA
jgi:DNA-binding transcriptional regulator YiaG